MENKSFLDGTAHRILLRLSVLFTFLALLSLLYGCDRQTAHPTDVLRHAIECEVTVRTGSIVYRADLSLGEYREDGVRDAEIRFLSPDALEGLAVRRSATGYVLLRDEIKVERDPSLPSGLLLLETLFHPAEAVRTDALTENGEAYTVFLLADGRRIYADVETGEIRAIEKEEIRVDVERISTDDKK